MLIENNTYMKTMAKLSLLVLLLCTTVLATSAQKTMTLKECVELAVENSLDVGAAKIGMENTALDVLQAQHNRYPSLSADANVATSFGLSVNPITDQAINTSFLSNRLGINTGVAVFNGFRISNALRAAKLDYAASMLDVSQQKRTIALTVANTYLQALFARENLKVAQSQLAVSENQLDQVTKLITAGSRPANEALTLEAQIATNQQSVIAAENSETIALLTLKQLMLMSPSDDITVVEPVDVTLYNNIDELEFDAVYASARSNEPSLQAADLRLQSAHINEKIAKGGLLPSVNAFGGISSNYAKLLNPPIGAPDQAAYGTQIEDNLSYNVGLSMSVPIYSNFENRINMQRSKLNYLNTENTNAALENQLMNTVQQAMADAKAAKRRFDAGEKSVAAQELALNNASASYQAGAINSFEYVTTQNNAAQAKVNALIAKYEYVFAMKVLDFYMGKPLTL